MTDLVSIIILTYKNFLCLEDAVNSVILQDYPRIELIIQDDGSDNYDFQYVSSLSEKKGENIENVIICRNEENLGTVKNFNAAIKRASGEYIIPLASDDRFADKDIVSAIVRFFTDSGCEICTGKRKGVESGVIWPTDQMCDLLKKGDNSEILNRVIFGNFISGSCTYFRKSFLERVNYCDERFLLVEDYPMIAETLLKGIKIYLMDKVVIFYGENGVSSKKGKVSLKLRRDGKLLYEILIEPNLKLFKNNRIKRYLIFRYRYIYFAERPMEKIVLGICYIDALLQTFLFRILMFSQDKEYDYLR